LNKKPLIYIILSAVLFGLSAPFSKLLLGDIPGVMLAGLLYLGAFLGLILYSFLGKQIKQLNSFKAIPLEKRDIPWLIGAILAGGVAAPISLMFGLSLISGFSASLLLNLEGSCTAVIAVIIFRENAGRNLWLALLCMTAAGIMISWDPGQSKFNILGPLLIVLATFCWGIDNNLTRQISEKNPIQITWIKGLTAGLISLSIALILGNRITFSIHILYALVLGAFSYGISLVLFIEALKGLGSSRTGAFFSMGPFVGALVSLIIFRNQTEWLMIPSFLLMAAGIWLIVVEKHAHAHTHKAVTHTHPHKHNDLHHLHSHPESIQGLHTHEHIHTELNHFHPHWPDITHRHVHKKI
jgi:drug/metabolite transporter (DMT)-like permease